MKKRVTIVALLTLALTFGLFAQEETVKLKGKVTVSNRINPELSANGKTSLLIMPRFISEDLKDGEEIAIEGTKGEINRGKGFRNVEKIEVIFVKKLTVDGKTVDIEKEFCGDRNGMRGPRVKKDFRNGFKMDIDKRNKNIK
ncbi:MAG TPA: hypothetical protein PK385_03740 [Spirochaetota bacterium]|jgi:hypothetical protein|nr:MAG: hypothetical protein BWX91_01190 [Spirochaetes bacterium ADurb.Bin133]HNZ27766.1 hypothetical protein [Spirochaetota bacterium]HOF01367.1 hypothetical protein [Spirochaetota bacterium]HOS31943.1 hypothetical protein [Spirochaetota bacterium]HOS55150.1 hypothetical protein [Spirochaetota bacterium]